MNSRLPLLSLALIFAAIELVGCSHPFWATDNKLLLYLPGTERRSDEIEGILRPMERRKRIEEKGEKGANAPKETQEILVFQLIQEYERSTDPSIRRVSIDALAKIVRQNDFPSTIPFLLKVMEDESVDVRIAAVNALGGYSLRRPKDDKSSSEIRERVADLLARKYSELAFSVNPGDQAENQEKKDLRVAILRNLGQFDDSEKIIAALHEGLDGEKLDDGALRLTAMESLEKVTGKGYGLDYGLWSGYVAFREGKAASEPKEPSILSKITPSGDIPLLK